MKLVVQGIEEIELTDPQGLCNLSRLAPVSQLPQPPRQGNPIYPTPPRPAIVGGWGAPTIRPIPGTGDVAVPHRPSIYTRHDYDPNDPFTRAKWGIGGPMIQQAGDPKDPDNFEKNWQAGGQPAELTDRSKRILRGEDPDGD